MLLYRRWGPSQAAATFPLLIRAGEDLKAVRRIFRSHRGHHATADSIRPRGGFAGHRDDLAGRHHRGPRRRPVRHGLRAPDARRERAADHGGRPQQDRRWQELEPRDRLDTPRPDAGNRPSPTHLSGWPDRGVQDIPRVELARRWGRLLRKRNGDWRGRPSPRRRGAVSGRLPGPDFLDYDPVQRDPAIGSMGSVRLRGVHDLLRLLAVDDALAFERLRVEGRPEHAHPGSFRDRLAAALLAAPG